jgi:hypothetical protein
VSVQDLGQRGPKQQPRAGHPEHPARDGDHVIELLLQLAAAKCDAIKPVRKPPVTFDSYLSPRLAKPNRHRGDLCRPLIRRATLPPITAGGPYGTDEGGRSNRTFAFRG